MLHMAITWWYQHKDHSLFVSILTRQYYSNMSFSVDAYIHCSLDRSICFCWQLKWFINGISFSVLPWIWLVAVRSKGDIFSSQRTPSEAQGVCFQDLKNSCWWGFPQNLFLPSKVMLSWRIIVHQEKSCELLPESLKKCIKLIMMSASQIFEGASDIENILGD